MRKYEPYKRIFRFLFAMVLIGCEMALYWNVWLNYYNLKMEVPYNRTGNWLMVAVYGILLLLFCTIYGGLRIGYLRTFNLIYSVMLANICATAMIYLQITLVTKRFQDVRPLLFMMLGELVLSIVWSVICNLIYRKLYPPRRVLLVYGEHPIYSLMNKLHSRADRYIIGEIEHVSAGVDAICKKAGSYEGVILCDISSEYRNQILKYCYSQSIRIYTIPKISDIIIRSAESLHLFDTPLLLSRNTGLGMEQRFLKRSLDIVLSITGLLILSPVFFITAAAIKMFDRGPVFFMQERCTINGDRFMICKFRSMAVNAEKDGFSVPATNKDPRITPIGHFIRRLRIDELPQLFNILKGEMSIVGPRPERVEHVEIYSREIPEFVYRMKVKGGLTGYAQVYGKYNTTAYDKLKLDLMYIQNYSILLDIEIIFKTIKVLFMPESTEGFTSDQSAAVTKEDENGKDGSIWEKR